VHVCVCVCAGSACMCAGSACLCAYTCACIHALSAYARACVCSLRDRRDSSSPRNGKEDERTPTDVFSDDESVMSDLDGLDTDAVLQPRSSSLSFEYHVRKRFNRYKRTLCLDLAAQAVVLNKKTLSCHSFVNIARASQQPGEELHSVRYPKHCIDYAVYVCASSHKSQNIDHSSRSHASAVHQRWPAAQREEMGVCNT
jgi:hypothetical protein